MTTNIIAMISTTTAKKRLNRVELGALSALEWALAPDFDRPESEEKVSEVADDITYYQCLR